MMNEVFHNAASAASGALIMGFNLYLLRKIMLALFSGSGAKFAVAIFFLAAKLGLLLGMTWLCLRYLRPEIISFGLGALLPVIVFAGRSIKNPAFAANQS